MESIVEQCARNQIPKWMNVIESFSESITTQLSLYAELVKMNSDVKCITRQLIIWRLNMFAIVLQMHTKILAHCLHSSRDDVMWSVCAIIMVNVTGFIAMNHSYCIRISHSKYAVINKENHMLESCLLTDSKWIYSFFVIIFRMFHDIVRSSVNVCWSSHVQRCS